MNKTLHLRKYMTLTTGTNSVKLTLKEVLRMAIKAHIDFKLIGQRIKIARKKAGWSQEKLAETIDVAVAYLSRVERGGTTINLKRLSQISIALSVPLCELIEGVTKEENIYLDKEFKELLGHCSKDKQKLIYNIAKIVSGVKFV